VHYDGDVVTHAGGLYQAIADTAKTPPHPDWVCLAAPGQDGQNGKDGADGLTPIVRGTFAMDQTYKRLDIVARDRGAFIAKVDNPGNCPGEGWQLITAHGVQGDRGKPGDRGEKGEQGPPGVGIVSWKIDGKNYRAVPLLSDGNEGPVLELRALFEQFHEEADG
jgi:hypothetical protein